MDPHHASSDLEFIAVCGEASWFTMWPNFAPDLTESIEQPRREKWACKLESQSAGWC